MIKDLSLKAISVAVMAALLAAPAFGAVCTMSCSDEGRGCCCSSATDGALAYSADSCCDTGYSPESGRSTLLPDRVAGGEVRPVPLAGAALKPSLPGELPSSGMERALRSDRAASRGRSSPLFVLHASFLI